MNETKNKSNWFPTPRYLCRKNVVFEFLKGIGKGTFLDIGMGAGDLVCDLAQKGYKGVGIDYSEEAVEFARKKLNSARGVAIEKKDLFDVQGKYDIVFSFEVFEHIEDDMAAFRKSNELLSDNGHLIFSVPAHMKQWNLSDEWAGHYRRYEKNEIKKKLESAGFEVLKIYNYGFPITNLIKPVRDFLISHKDSLRDNKADNSKRSGVDRSAFNKLFAFLVNEYTMAPFYFLQRFFFGQDITDGYVVLARKVKR